MEFLGDEDGIRRTDGTGNDADQTVGRLRHPQLRVVSNILRKLEVTSRVDAAAIAQRLGNAHGQQQRGK